MRLWEWFRAAGITWPCRVCLRNGALLEKQAEAEEIPKIGLGSSCWVPGSEGRDYATAPMPASTGVVFKYLESHMQLEAQTGQFRPDLCVSACLKPSHLSGVQKPQVISLMSSGIYFKGISYIWLQKMRADVCNRGEGCEQSVLWSSHPLCSIHFQPIKFLKQITIQMTNELTWKKI